jgi:hypothetical protein
MEKIFDNGVDLLSLNIEIVGDPDWISQDNMLYGTKAGNSSQLSDHSINFSKEQYFDFFFFSPATDYNENSGLFGSDGDYADFSGRYRVISVKSKFSGGKFTQQLKNVRLRNQTASTSGSNRSDTINTNSIGSSGGGGGGGTGLPGTSDSYGITGSNNIRALAIGIAAPAISGAITGAVKSLFDTTNKPVPNNSKSGETADATIVAPSTDTNSKTDEKTGAAIPTPPVRPNEYSVTSGSSKTNPDKLAGDGSGSVTESVNANQQAVNSANNVTGSTPANPDRYVTDPQPVIPADTGYDPYTLGGSGQGSNSGITEDQAYPI